MTVLLIYRPLNQTLPSSQKYLISSQISSLYFLCKYNLRRSKYPRRQPSCHPAAEFLQLLDLPYTVQGTHTCAGHFKLCPHQQSTGLRPWCFQPQGCVSGAAFPFPLHQPKMQISFRNLINVDLQPVPEQTAEPPRPLNILDSHLLALSTLLHL